MATTTRSGVSQTDRHLLGWSQGDEHIHSLGPLQDLRWPRPMSLGQQSCPREPTRDNQVALLQLGWPILGTADVRCTMMDRPPSVIPVGRAAEELFHARASGDTVH